MVLTKDVLTSKALKRSCENAVALLDRIVKASGGQMPKYFTKQKGEHKFYYKVKLKDFPTIFKPSTSSAAYRSDSNLGSIVGDGLSTSSPSGKEEAKSLAALEALGRIEDRLECRSGQLQSQYDQYRVEQKRQRKLNSKAKANANAKLNKTISHTGGDKEMHTSSLFQLEGVTWKNNPPVDDLMFPLPLPASRFRRIDFNPELVANKLAFASAKALTLVSHRKLPTVSFSYKEIKPTKTKETSQPALQLCANVSSDPCITTQTEIDESPRMAKIRQTQNLGNRDLAQEVALEDIHSSIEQNTVGRELLQTVENPLSSLGMGKIFVSLPSYHCNAIDSVLEKLEARDQARSLTPRASHKQHESKRRKSSLLLSEKNQDDAAHLNSRIASFRAHQKSHPLPVDDIETKIPHDATVTIVRGGTGSGKTTRYPLMLSLFSPTGAHTKVLVAQPRRLACQTAAKRVAFEQGYNINATASSNRKHDVEQQPCPIGYGIRFESCFSTAPGRTVDFATPGVLLRRATNDPLLEDVTHLCIDEVHERNADMDLLLALAKQAQRRRADHSELPPLRIILMSATLDSTQWETYFRDENSPTDQNVRVVDVPGIRRFPIEISHLGDHNFPNKLQMIKAFRWCKPGDENFDEMLCRSIACLAVHLYQNVNRGSILCFLPGMDEIRTVDHFIREQSRRHGQAKVVYLHSTVSSEDQSRIFEPGAKIILSTNIAETSVTIPDVKIVIDSGLERQFSLLDSSSESKSVKVVGSQLVTVNISQASAKQRAGRAGRVSAGTCYRMYTRGEFEADFVPFATPEMLRMDVSHLVLHALSSYHSTSDHPLSLLLEAPDPPTQESLRQSLHSLSDQGLVDLGEKYDARHVREERCGERNAPHENAIALTPLGFAVAALPASPQISRMLFMGLALRAIEPALTYAALLSVPKVFSPPPTAEPLPADKKLVSSDIIIYAAAYNKYIQNGTLERGFPSEGREFEQVKRVRSQLERSLCGFLRKRRALPEIGANKGWNANASRIAAQSSLILSATPHIAHLVSGRTDFATRDIVGSAKMHPSTVNFADKKRVHWYVYHELRTTKRPYLHITTAVSPLEIALFSIASKTNESHGSEIEHLMVADQWVPVAVVEPKQNATFAKLRQLLMHDMLQEIARDPRKVLNDPLYEQATLRVLSAVDQQRVRPSD